MKKLSSIFLFAAIMSSAATNSSAESKLSSDLANVDPLSNVRVIVQSKTASTNVLDALVTGLLGTVLQHFSSVHGGLYQIPALSLSALANNPSVSFISLDRTNTAQLDNTAAAVNVNALWKGGFTGSGIGVAVIDSGMNPDPNLGGGKPPVYSYDFTQPAALATVSSLLAGITQPLPTSSIPSLASHNAPDQFGHGQHVAGIIASNGKDSQCSHCSRLFKGIAPNVNLIDLKVLDQNGQGTDSEVIAAIDMAIALKNAYNIRGINLSLGRPVYESYTQDPLCKAVESAWKAGIVVVVAAGNEGRDNTYGEQGYGTINAPGNDPYVITVGAMKTEGTYTRTDDLIASYSSNGPTQVDHIVKPDLVAPGNLVVSLLANGSTLAKQYPGNMVTLSYYQTGLNTNDGKKPSNSYFLLSGTSMAAPVVSAAAADLLQANSNLTPDQIKALLMQTASKSFPVSSSATDASTGQTYTDYYDIFTVGAGYIDLNAALAAISSVPPSGTALSPAAAYDPTSGTVTVEFDPSSIWASQSVAGSRALWGAQSVWGSSEIDSSDRALWGANSVWGQSSDQSSQTVWGARALWGASSMYDSQTPSSSNTDSGSRALWGANISITGEK